MAEEEKKAAPKKRAAKPKESAAEPAEAKPAKAKKGAAPQPAAKPAAARPKATPEKPKKTPEKTVTVTQVGSPIGRQAYQRATLKGLGLDKLHRTRVLEDTPAVRGMIERVKHLLRVEAAS